MNPLFDTHCHLYDRQFEPDLDAVLECALQNSVEHLLIPSENLATSLQVIHLCAVHKNIALFAAGGIHPHYAEQGKKEFAEFKTFFKNHDFVAVGEIGLDYYRMLSDKKSQVEMFRACLDFAAEVEKPLLLHNREATEDMLSILQEWLRQLPGGSPLKKNPGVFHSYNGDPLILDFALSHHFYLGIGGMITFKNANSLREIVKNIPVDRLLLETDSPSLSPHPYRGKRNEPAHVRFVAEELSQIVELPLEKIIEKTTRNALHLLGKSTVK